MRDFVESKESSYLKYWDINSLYGWAMLQKRPKNIFSGSKIILDLMNAS